MVFKFQCSLEAQDCMTLYPGTQGRVPSKLPFTNQSCVRDPRLDGNVGRCGFPGAPCIVDSRGQDNCAGGESSEQPAPKSLVITYNPSQLARYHFAGMANAEGQYHYIALPTHTRELKLTLCDSDREPGANCLFNEDCNCKSKTFHNSLLYLRISQGGINCNSSFVPGVPGLCGGYLAYMNDSEASDGLDFGRDYCLSGKFPCIVQESP